MITQLLSANLKAARDNELVIDISEDTRGGEFGLHVNAKAHQQHMKAHTIKSFTKTSMILKYLTHYIALWRFAQRDTDLLGVLPLFTYRVIFK